MPSLDGAREPIRPKRQHARAEADSVILEGKDPRRRHQHDRPPLQPLVVRHDPVPLVGHAPHRVPDETGGGPAAAARRGGGGAGGDDTVLPQVRGAVVQALPDLGELQPRGDDHDAEHGARERAEQVEQRGAEQQAEEELRGAEEHDARAAARAEAVLRREPARPVAHGHGAEPAAREVHERDADAQLRDGRRRGRAAREARAHELGGESGRRDDAVERRQGQLRDGHGPGGAGAKVGHGRAGPPDLEPRERRAVLLVGGVAAADEDGGDGEDQACAQDDQGVGEAARGARRGDEQEEGGDGPEAVVEGVAGPGQGGDHGAAARDDELQAGAELDALDDGDGDVDGQPAQQAGGGQQADGGGDQGAGSEGLGLGGVRGDGGGGDGLHGLDGEGHAEEDAGEDVEQAAEDEGRGERDGVLQGEGDHERQQGAEVAQGTRYLGEGRAAKLVEVVPVEAADVTKAHGGDEV